MIGADLVATTRNTDDATAIGEFKEAVGHGLQGAGKRKGFLQLRRLLIVEGLCIFDQFKGFFFFLRLKQNLDARSGHGRVSEEANAEPGKHHVARFFNEQNGLLLKAAYKGSEKRLVRKGPIRAEGSGFLPVAVFGTGVFLEPDQGRGNHLRYRVAAAGGWLRGILDEINEFGGEDGR